MNSTQLLQKLKTQKIILASVESCTGGRIADQITDIAGISEHFWGSWIVYDVTAKLTIGVDASTIKQYGVVSSQTALGLAENGLKKLTDVLEHSDPTTIGVIQPWKTLAVVSTTGIAGPSGGTAQKPVGLCYSAVAILHSGQTLDHLISRALEIQAPSGLSRVQYKEYFAQKTLEFLTDCLQKESSES